MEPPPVLRELHRTLVPGGAAIVKGPNFGSLNRMVMGNRWCGFRYPDHLNYFTPRTLRAAAEACGFRARFGLTFRLPTSDKLCGPEQDIAVGLERPLRTCARTPWTLGLNFSARYIRGAAREQIASSE